MGVFPISPFVAAFFQIVPEETMENIQGKTYPINIQ
jgi:hypothetical protein